MSGPKGGSYTVVSAEELERRALRAARDRYDRVRTAHSAVCESIALDESPPARLPKSVAGTSAMVSAAAADAETRLATARTRLTDLRLAAALEATPKIKLTLTLDSRSGQAPAVAVAQRPLDASAGQATVAKAEKIVAKALAELGESAVGPLSGPLDLVRSAEGSGQSSLALDHLRFQVQNLRDAARLTRRQTELREAVLTALDGCTSEEALSLRDRLLATNSGPGPVTLEYARSLAEREKRQRDAEFVEDAVLDVIAELGYQVGESVGVSVAKGGVLVEVPGHPQHLARVHRAGDQLRFNVVRVGAGDPGQDAEAETVACGFFQQLQQGLSAEGVDWKVSRREVPGAVPLPSIEALPPGVASKPAPGARRQPQRRRARERAREMDR